LPAADHSLYFIMDESADILRRLVKYGHAAGSKVCITVGGWTGSQYFSDAVSNDWNRQKFAQNIVDMVNAYDADGIDIDWEYPGQNGAYGNGVSADDSDNFLIFVKLLRSMLGKDKVISMATPLNVWYGSNGQPMTDVSAFAPLLDHVLLMNYDVWGASSNPGPNAPLNVCGNSDQPEANAVNAVENWEAAGMPASKIMLGIPAYGYVSDSTATSLIHKRDVHARRAAIADQDNERRVAALARQHMRMGNTFPVLKDTASSKRLARRADDEETPATATSSEKVFDMPTGIPVKAVNTQGNLDDFKGSQIQFNQLISYRAISLSTTGVWYGKNGYTRRWDSCSQTPFLFNQVKSTVVTYDDPVSIKIKAEFAASKKLRGTGMWDIGGDSEGFVLTKAARSGLGI
jgi:chitinase